MNQRYLVRANLIHHLGRSFGLAAIVALLSCAVFGGMLVVSSLQSGLESLESRLGADVIVGPASGQSRVDFSELLVEGVPGSFYMDKSLTEAVAAVEGVERVTPQFYLATMKAGCCDMPVQIIGYDPETDFVATPWIARSFGESPGLFEVMVGCNVSGSVGSSIQFYGKDCTIVAKLAETGTSLDNAVFAPTATVQELATAAEGLGFSPLAHEDPSKVVSTLMVKVADGHSPEQVADFINLRIRGVHAEASRALTSSVSDSVGALAGVIRVLLAVVALLAFAVLVAVFAIIARQRTHEFAILRMLGASKGSLANFVLREAMLVSAGGALVGIGAALMIVLAFNSALENALGLPFLLPDPPTIGVGVLSAFLLALVAGCAASVVVVLRMANVEPGPILQKG